MKTTTQFFNLKRTVLASLFMILISLGTFAQSSNDANGIEGDGSMKIILEYTSTEFNTREIMVVANDAATESYDVDFDFMMSDAQDQDMYWMIEGEAFIEQGVYEIKNETVLPIGISTNLSGLNSIAIHKLENIPASTKIFLLDKDSENYFDLSEGAYEVFLEEGNYNNRFELVFETPDTLGVNDTLLDEKSLRVFYNISASQINLVNNSGLNIEAVEVYNINGQKVLAQHAINSRQSVKIDTLNMSAGAYIVMTKANNNIQSKKILIQ